VIGLLFAGSAAARLTDPEGAVAQEATAMAAREDSAARSCPRPQEAGPLLEAVREREAQLEARAREIADRERALEAAQATYREQAARLDEAEKRLAETLALADTAADRDVARLVAVYEAMKPKDAAAIFESMDVTFAAGFLARMKRDAAAEKAYSISVVMAGRNARAPTR